MAGDLIPIKGRRSDGMEEENWMHLADAYDTWNSHVDYCEIMGTAIDPDLRAYIEDVFGCHDLWDYDNDEPMLGKYRQMIYQRC